jgi:histidinol-phosphate phosphatase family protein
VIQVVILAGGKGTRLKVVTGDVPKPLAKANGRPLLDLQLVHFAACGVKDVLVLTGYGADQIAAFVGNGSRWGLSVRCVSESEPLGTAGALFHTRSLLASEFLVVYGDTVFDFDLERMLIEHRSAASIATILLHPNDHPQDSDLVEVDMADRAVAFHPYPHTGSSALPNLVNAGVYVFNRDILDWTEQLPERPDFGKHVFPLLIRAGQAVQGYRSPEYVKDAGTPERLAQVSRDLAAGRVAEQSMRIPSRAVFLDRDGTLNLEKGGIVNPEDIELIPGTAAAVARLNHSAYRTVVVTNQAVIARGDCNEGRLRELHNHLESLLGGEGAYLDRIYYCPHIPDRGFAGERVELKIHCDCRKPEIGMPIRAAREMNIDLAGSWMVGDSTGDVETAHRAGLISILLSTGHAGLDGKWSSQPDAECVDLSDAVSLILDRWPVMLADLAPTVSRIALGDLVLLGGQARVGKSQYASALRRSLEAAGKSAVVICLDSWLRAETERVGSSVLDRYDLASAAEFLNHAKGSGGRFRLARYDRLGRRPVAEAIELQVPPRAVLIVEGVPALASPLLATMAQHRIAVRRCEDRRRSTMRRDYAARGWSQQRIERLIAERLEDEFPVIQNSLVSADVIFDDGLQS